MSICASPDSRASSSTSPAGRQSRAGLACLLLAAVLWGTGGLFGALLGRVAGLSPVSVAAYRLLAGGFLIIAFLTVTRRPRPSGRAAWTRIAVTGLLSALFQSCYFAAISLTSVSLATLVTIGGTPVLVAAVEVTRDRHALGRSGALTLVLALAGLGLLVGLPGGGFGEAAVLTSAGLALLSAAGFAAVTLIGASPVPGLDDLTVNGYAFTLGGIVLLPLAALIGSGLEFRFGLTGGGLTAGGLTGGGPLAAAGLLLALATGPTAVAYTLYFRGLRTASASTAALLSLLEPLTAAVLAALILGDRLSGAGIAGAVILLAAVARAMRAGAG
jgi:drug/metabolite transporter, DME family